MQESDNQRANALLQGFGPNNPPSPGSRTEGKCHRPGAHRLLTKQPGANGLGRANGLGPSPFPSPSFSLGQIDRKTSAEMTGDQKRDSRGVFGPFV